MSVRGHSRVITFCLVAALIALLGNFGFAPIASAQNPPTITSITPTGGPTAGGTAVAISGSGFNGTETVTVGGTTATVTSSAGSPTLNILTPAHAAGTVDIVVTDNHGSTALSSADQFTYELAPTVTSVTPIAGPAAGGTSVTIAGTNLSNVTGVSFGATAATTFSTGTGTSLTATAPAGTIGTVNVTVTTFGGTSATSSADDFTYEAAPTVSAVSPTIGASAGGTSVSITGTNFLAASAVKFATTNATSFTVNSATSITAVAPAGSVGTVDVTVTTPSGTSATSTSDHYTFQAAPTLTSVSPVAGTTGGGTSVTILGTNFSNASAVKFGSTNATSFTVNSATSITAVAPAGSVGTVDITVTTPGGVTGTGSADHFTYDATPTISSDSPNFGAAAGGTSVTITGTGFLSTTSVKFGATNATSFTINSDTSITAVAPAHAAGQVDITVTNPTGTSATGASDQFTFDTTPAVSSDSPNAGPATGGTSVTITGSGFLTATGVKFGATSATSFVINSDTSITAVAPAHASGQVDVTVTNPTGTSGTGAGDKFTYDTTPTIGSDSPSSGPAAGGTSVTITGSGFLTATGVSFGGVAATSFTINTDGSITAVAPAGSAGTVDITVTNSTGTSATSGSDKFTYDTTPTVGSDSPSAGPAAGGTPVTITGTGFLTTTAVKFGATNATSFTINSDTSITAVAPAHAAGQVDVTVVNSTGTSATGSSDKFTFDSTPAVGSDSPNAGPAAGGTSVTITGSGFLTATSVSFGGVPATSFTINSDGSITAVAPAGSAGAVDITVTNSTGTSATSSSDQFTYDTTPTVGSDSPSAGSVGGGTSVTLTGSGFLTATGVSFGGVPATSFTINSDGSITAIAPAGSAGTVNITVTNSTGTSATGPSNKFTYDQAPTVNGASPNAGPTAGGTSVTINGSGYMTATDVKFGGVSATSFTINSDGSITAVCPPGSPGQVDIVVSNTTGTATPSGSDKFTYDAAPTVGSVSPIAGAAAGGTSVTITGSGFMTASSVSFGGVAATSFTINNDGSITAVAPAGSAGTVDITVTNATGTSTAGAGDQFTFDTTPTIGSASPSAGPIAGGTSVTITGSGFLTATGVSFGGTPATSFTINSDGSITAVAPAGTAGTVDITVTNTTGTSSTSGSDQFTFQNVPAISGISPSAGPVGGGTSVAITGSDFINVTSVNFGGTAATSFTVNSSTSITAFAPAESAGTVDITVTTPGGISPTSSSDQFAFGAVPQVGSLSKTSGPVTGGTAVSICGTGLSGTTEVDFGSTSVSFTVTSGGCTTIPGDDVITVLSPAGQFGTVDVTLQSPYGNSSITPSDVFTTQPIVTGVSPAAGPISGGTSLVVTGQGFSSTQPGFTNDITSLSFGQGTIPIPSADYTVVSSTEIDVTTPAVTAPQAGTYRIYPSTSLGQGFATAGSNYILAAVPVLSDVVHASGPDAGGNVLSVYGNNFLPNGLTSVSFQQGSTVVPSPAVTYVWATTLQVTVPSVSTGGIYNMVVSTPGGTSSTIPYTYYDQPTVTSVNAGCAPPLCATNNTTGPGVGTTAGGTSVNIAGTGFAPNGFTTVQLGGASVAFSYVSSTLLHLTTRAGSAGTQDYTVTTPGGTSATSSADQFTYIQPATSGSISPAAGVTAGGNTVTVSTTGVLSGWSYVKFGTVNILPSSITYGTNGSLATLTFVVPSHAAGAVTISVVTQDVGTLQLTSQYRYESVPKVTKVSPAAGPLVGGNSVVVTGSGFIAGDTAVSFGTTSVDPGNITVTSATSLTVIAPPGSVGIVNVVVSNSVGSSTTGTATQYSYDAVPTVTSINPTTGAPGSYITVHGTGFVTGATTVSFGSVAGTSVTVFGPTLLTVFIPSGQASGSVVDVTVTTPGGTSAATASDRFTYP